MKKILILICLTLFNFSNVSAVTLFDALNQSLSKQYSIKC